MDQREPILFVCTHNLSRSYTAEYLFSENAVYEVRSAGTSESARLPVSRELIAWAARVFVMETAHVESLRERFGDLMEAREIICLDIPDIYLPLEPELIMLLRQKLAPYMDGI